MNDYSCRGSLPPEIVTPSYRRNSAVDDASLYTQTYGMDFLHEVSMSKIAFRFPSW